MHFNVSRSTLFFLFAAIALSVNGCGQRQYNVTGKVTYNGFPLTESLDGHIVFVGAQGEQIECPIAPDGSYQANSLPAGMYRIAAYYKNPKAADSKKRKKGPEDKIGVQPFLTPEKYASVETSELALDVTKDSVFDVNMTGSLP